MPSSEQGEPFLAEPRPILHPLEHPTPLPKPLATFLREQRFTSLLHATDIGTILIVKASRHAIGELQGPMPIAVRHELYSYPSAPVIRTVTRLYDQPHAPLTYDCFTNVAAPDQRATFAALGRQRAIHLFFYDEELTHTLTKQIAIANRPAVRQVLREADRLAAAIPADRYDFDAARAAVQEGLEL